MVSGRTVRLFESGAFSSQHCRREQADGRFYFSGAIEGELTVNFSSSEACSKCRPAAERKMWAECGSLMSRANSRQCSACSR
jgi:hypothetical protein